MRSASIATDQDEPTTRSTTSTGGTLRILHVLTHDQVTRGGAVQAMLLAAGQHAHGHQVEVVFNARHPGPLHETIQPWIERGLTAQAFHMKRPAEIVRFRRMLAKRRPDVIHCHRNDALQFVWFGTLGLRHRVAVVSQRGTTRAPQTPLIGFIHKSRRVHRIIAVAEAVKTSLTTYGVDGDKIHVIYGSFDPRRFDPDRVRGDAVRDELGVAPGQPLIVQLGQLNNKKAPQMFVHTAAELIERRDDCVFALVGPGGLFRECRKLAQKLELGDRFHMLGFRPDVPEIYAAADVVVNSSYKDEGLTGALREALAMGKPVVATRVSGNPEVVRHEETGLLVEPRDPAQMADAIERLVDDRELAVRLGQAGRELVSAAMNPDVRIASTEAVYRAAIADL